LKQAQLVSLPLRGFEIKKREEGEYAMKNNAIWWIVLIVVVVLGVYFLVANRQSTPAPASDVNTVTPGQGTSAPVAPSDQPGTSAPGTVSPAPSAGQGTVTNPSNDSKPNPDTIKEPSAPVQPTPAQ